MKYHNFLCCNIYLQVHTHRDYFLWVLCVSKNMNQLLLSMYYSVMMSIHSWPIVSIYEILNEKDGSRCMERRSILRKSLGNLRPIVNSFKHRRSKNIHVESDTTWRTEWFQGTYMQCKCSIIFRTPARLVASDIGSLLDHLCLVSCPVPFSIFANRNLSILKNGFLARYYEQFAHVNS